MLAFRPEISLTSTLLRFYQMNEGGTIPRATAIGSHDVVVEALPKNLETLCGEPAISRLTIWNRELEMLFDSNIDTIAPSTVLMGLWNSPWSAEELQAMHHTIEILRQKEAASHLGQGDAIDELEHRIYALSQNNLQNQSLDMTCF